MTTEEGPLYELVEKPETAWNVKDSVAWAALFAEGADFIHIPGGHYHGRVAIEQGHRTIFDTIYKGSHDSYTVEGVRFIRRDVAVVFISAYLRGYWNGAEQHIDPRPTLMVHKKDGGQWEIVALQNTLITPGARTPEVVKKLADAHPYKATRRSKRKRRANCTGVASVVTQWRALEAAQSASRIAVTSAWFWREESAFLWGKQEADPSLR